MTHYVDYHRVYRDSYLRIHGTVIGDKGFFDRFYEQFLASSAEAKEKFKNTDFSRQKEMLRDSLGHMERFSLYKRADDIMLKLAKKHSRAELDIQPHLYDVWLTSLIVAVKEFDSEFDDDVEIAWRMALAAGIEYMKFKYER